MSNDDFGIEDDDRLDKRRNRQIGDSKNSGNGLFKIIFIVACIIALPFIILGPQGALDLVGLNTSESEEIQQATRIDTGISTRLPSPQVTPDTQVPDIQVPAPRQVANTPVSQELSEADKKRIADLESKLEELRNQPTDQGVSAEQMSQLLEAQARTLRDENRRQVAAQDQKFQQQLAAIQAAVAARGPNNADLAAQRARERQALLDEQERQRKIRLEEEARSRDRQAEEEAKKRLEERRQKAAELRQKQLDSESILFDGTEEGETAPGSSDSSTNNQSVRELSSNEQFLQDAGSSSFETSRANNLGDLGEIIVQGTIISAVLETAINTELPGIIRAQVTEPVFSYDGSEVLMPSGTRIIGTFNSDISTAQSRVLIAWNRAITPSGESVELGSTGTDRLGRSGTAGNVDSRFLERFGSAIVISVISAIPSFLSTETESANVEAANDVANNASSDLGEQAETALEDYLNLPPIIRVPQGEEIRILVNRDLVFS